LKERSINHAACRRSRPQLQRAPARHIRIGIIVVGIYHVVAQKDFVGGCRCRLVADISATERKGPKQRGWTKSEDVKGRLINNPCRGDRCPRMFIRIRPLRWSHTRGRMYFPARSGGTAITDEPAHQKSEQHTYVKKNPSSSSYWSLHSNPLSYHNWFLISLFDYNYANQCHASTA